MYDILKTKFFKTTTNNKNKKQNKITITIAITTKTTGKRTIYSQSRGC